jgi:hypothetical protein
MKEFPTFDVIISGAFWSPRLAVNTAQGIFHQ